MSGKNFAQIDLFGHVEEVSETPKKRAKVVLEYPRAAMVRVSPTAWAWKPVNSGDVPTYGRLRWIDNGDGTFRPAPQGGKFCVVTRELLDEIGFRGINRSISDTTLRRLAAAEEIVMFHISPRVRMLDIDSWWKYMDECMNDPEKWEEQSESWKNYMFRNALGRSKV